MNNWGRIGENGVPVDVPVGTPVYYLIEWSTTQDFSSGYVF
jgi:hypothetical protein